MVGFVWNFSHKLIMITSADMNAITVKQNHIKRSPNGRSFSAIYRTPCNVELLCNDKLNGIFFSIGNSKFFVLQKYKELLGLVEKTCAKQTKWRYFHFNLFSAQRKPISFLIAVAVIHVSWWSPHQISDFYVFHSKEWDLNDIDYYFFNR